MVKQIFFSIIEEISAVGRLVAKGDNDNDTTDTGDTSDTTDSDTTDKMIRIKIWHLYSLLTATHLISSE